MRCCDHDFACDCDEQTDTRIVGAWADHDEATTPKRYAGHGLLPRVTSQPPSLRLVVGAVPPSEPRPEQGRGSRPSEHRMARQERAARNALRPRTGQVFAFPTKPPLKNESGGPHTRPAA